MANSPHFPHSPQTEPAGTQNCEHKPIQEERLRLWASKSLDLMWLPESWATPFYHETKWYWRVDAMFGARVLTVQRRAAEKGIVLVESELGNAELVRNYLEELGQWAEAERLASAGPVSLPTQVVTETADLVRFGFSPATFGAPLESLLRKHSIPLTQSPPDDAPGAPEIRPPAPSRDKPRAKPKLHTPQRDEPALF